MNAVQEVVGTAAASRSRYVASVPLRWGDRTIPVGEPVPEGDESRDYAGLVKRGHIVDVMAPGKSAASPQDLARVEAKIDAVAEKVDRLLGAGASPSRLAPDQDRFRNGRKEHG